MKKRISMKDISKELGISTTTISFIINNNKAKNRISKEVIKKVEDYVEKVGYKPNFSARSLRTGKSKTIGLMVEDISDPFFSAIAREIEEIAFDHGYKIIYCSTENKKDRTLELLNLFKEREVDAFIITPPEDFEEEMEKLIYKDQQIVMAFDRYFKNFKHNYVVLENLKSAYIATNSIFNSGRKRIAFIGIDSDLSPLTERLEGYKKAIKALGLKEHILLLKFSSIKTSRGLHLIKKFLLENPDINGILFASNGLAVSGLRVIKSLSINIPEELGVISFDERDFFELFTPSISVVSQPVKQLAAELTKGTLKLIKSKDEENFYFQKSLPGKLITRKSLKKL